MSLDFLDQMVADIIGGMEDQSRIQLQELIQIFQQQKKLKTEIEKKIDKLSKANSNLEEEAKEMIN